MKINHISIEDKRSIARAHAGGNYKAVQSILAKNKVSGCHGCVNAFALREWCIYWVETGIIPEIIKLPTTKMKIK